MLARAARLDAAIRTVLEGAAVVPTRVELSLLADLTDATSATIDACINAGILVASGDGAVAFRHELARAAVEENLPPARRLALHDGTRRCWQRASTPTPPASPTHAAAAGNGPLARPHAGAAARRARRLGAHREAAALRRAGGDTVALATSLQVLSQAQWDAGASREAEASPREAIALLEQHGDSVALADNYATITAYHMLTRQLEGTLHGSVRGIAVAERTGAARTLARSLNARGSIKVLNELQGGRQDLERSMAVAGEAGLTSLETLAGAISDRPRARSGTTRDRRTGAAGGHLPRHRPGQRPAGGVFVAWLARVRLEQGDWAEAESLADGLRLGRTRTAPLTAITALTVLGVSRPAVATRMLRRS